MRKNSKNITGRKKGGQPGNKNALRHGFYSELFSTEDSHRLDKEFNLLDELKAMRVKAFHLFRLTPLEKFNKRELITFDRFLNAIISINTLERTRLLARGHGGEIGQTILEALRELNPYEEL
jgi:hypothetical protein